jgi:hypothetical protein
MQSAGYSCPIFKDSNFSRQIFEKSSNIKFHENPSVQLLHADRQTDRRRDVTKLIVDFRSFENAPQNLQKKNAVHNPG